MKPTGSVNGGSRCRSATTRRRRRRSGSRRGWRRRGAAGPRGGAEALWSGGPLAELGASETPAAGGRLEADLGYGLPVGSRLVGTPRIGVGASEMGRDYRLGYSLGVLGGEALDFVLGVQAQRRERALHGDASNEMSLQATLGW